MKALVAETTFALTYDGPALGTGRMPVRELAPALLALGDLFTEASAIVYPTGEPVSLSIKATETGSFDVHLILEAGGLWDQVVGLLTSDAATAIATLETLVLGSLGIFAVIRRLGGREIEREEPTEPGYVKVTLEDGTSLEMRGEVAKMYRSVRIRRRARDVVAPLAREGVEVVRFAPSREPELVVSKQDLLAYEEAALEPGDVLLDEERVMHVQIASVSFEGHKWRLSEGGQLTFWASMEDEEFATDVERAVERFAQGDILRCRIRVVQTRRPEGGLQTEYHVVKALQHLTSHTQLTLDEGASTSDE